MGLDVVAALKKRGYEVTRKTYNGFSDAKLVNAAADLPDPQTFSLVVLFGGASNPGPTPTTLLKLVNYFGGPSKVRVVLPPYNMAKESPNVMTDPSTKGWVNSQALEKAGVLCYRVTAPGNEITDGVHLRQGSPVSRAVAEQVTSGLVYVPGKSSIGVPSAVAGGGVALALGLGLLWWWMRGRHG